jgi:hypothetical protein
MRKKQKYVMMQVTEGVAKSFYKWYRKQYRQKMKRLAKKKLQPYQNPHFLNARKYRQMRHRIFGNTIAKAVNLYFQTLFK